MVVVQFEERSKPAMRRYTETLTYYIPMTWLDLATELGILCQLGAKIFEDLYTGWAKRRNFPPPPIGNSGLPPDGGSCA